RLAATLHSRLDGAPFTGQRLLHAPGDARSQHRRRTGALRPRMMAAEPTRSGCILPGSARLSTFLLQRTNKQSMAASPFIEQIQAYANPISGTRARGSRAAAGTRCALYATPGRDARAAA